MDTVLSSYMLSRIQFAVITTFHILFPPLTIGMAAILLAMEILWLHTKNEFYLRHMTFWTKLFILNFGVGVVSGLPLEFAFGTNWAPFTRGTGTFVGNLLGYEAVIAFMLEAAFVSIMVFGRKRVPPGLHLFATGMVTLGAILSAFWIMSANAWMQTPAGAVFYDGKVVITDYLAAIFNPDLPLALSHMLNASFELGVFVLGGVSAWFILKERYPRFFLATFKAAALAAVVIAPLQIWIGDTQGRALQSVQPEKLAAIEAHWNTNPPGRGAPWALLAWPDEKMQQNAWAIEIPDALSLLITHSPAGEVKGLKAFPPQNQPPVWIPFYAFRIMVAAGFFLAFVALWTIIAWYRGRLAPERAPQQRKLLIAWLWTIPMTYLAIEAGWYTREVGRQPWVVYGVFRTQDAYTPHPVGMLLWSLAFYILIYGAIILTAFFFARRIIQRGPKLESAP